MLRRSVRLLKVSPLTKIPSLHNKSLLSTRISSFSSSTPYRNDQPWYMNPEESPSITSPLKEMKIPELPPNHPQTLENIVTFLARELGIDDLIIFDMRNKLNDDDIENEGAYDISDFMIIGTGKSSKHLQKASSQLDFYIKHNLHKLAVTEGILRTGELAKYNRRLLRRGKTAPNYSKNTYGAEPNTWIMTDTKSDGIIVHMLTKKRREDLNLEYLWSKKSEKSKYTKDNNDTDSDDIFRGIRYFHSSTKVNQTERFNVYELTPDNYYSYFNRLIRSHLVDSKLTPFSSIMEHLDLIYSAGFAINANLLYSYLNAILQSPELNSSFESDAKAFVKRNNLFATTLKKYNIQLTTEEILKLTPLLIISGSQFDNPSFLTIKKIIENPDIKHDELTRYSKTLNDLFRLSNKIMDSTNQSHRDFKRDIDLLLISVYANRLNWVHFNQIIKSAITRNDISILKAALPLVTVCADLQTSVEFNDNVLPFISESGINPELAPFVERLSHKIHNTN